MIHKKSEEKIVHQQEVSYRFLKPPEPTPDGEIIIRKEADKQLPEAPPLIFREHPEKQKQPEPLVIREMPPKKL